MDNGIWGGFAGLVVGMDAYAWLGWEGQIWTVLSLKAYQHGCDGFSAMSNE
jgi:hypothetical protein